MASDSEIINGIFNELMITKMDFINSITPLNPTIAKDDEWVKETFWDTDYQHVEV